MNRKKFLRTGLIGTCGMAASMFFGRTKYPAGKNALDPEQVKEFVLAGHNDLHKVKEMLREEPNLLYARHDWGGGDFEEAIEGAGHVGERAIAKFLIEQGARVNVFVLTMLGKTELVIPLLEEYPTLIQAKGPHGFTLLHHAEMGGAPSGEIRAYLMEHGLKEYKVEM